MVRFAKLHSLGGEKTMQHNPIGTMLMTDFFFKSQLSMHFIPSFPKEPLKQRQTRVLYVILHTVLTGLHQRYLDSRKDACLQHLTRCSFRCNGVKHTVNSYPIVCVFVHVGRSIINHLFPELTSLQVTFRPVY